MNDWLNALDPMFNLHLKTTGMTDRGVCVSRASMASSPATKVSMPATPLIG
jgi:putative heme degradation protein